MFIYSVTAKYPTKSVIALKGFLINFTSALNNYALCIWTALLSHLIYRMVSEYESLLRLSEPFIIKPEPSRTAWFWVVWSFQQAWAKSPTNFDSIISNPQQNKIYVYLQRPKPQQAFLNLVDSSCPSLGLLQLWSKGISFPSPSRSVGAQWGWTTLRLLEYVHEKLISILQSYLFVAANHAMAHEVFHNDTTGHC